MQIKLFLPIPQSVNSLYHNNSEMRGGGRSKTKKAKSWAKEARYYVQPFMQAHKAICDANINMRNQHWVFSRKCYDLNALRQENPDLAYAVEYRFYFPNDIPRDVFNFEKQLSDFLVDCGFMLDDCFISVGTVKRMAPDPENPRVVCIINSLDSSESVY
jgi:hypothetical protein